MEPTDRKNIGHETIAGFSATEQKEINKGIYRLDIAIRKSIRYHAKRRRFFDNWHYCSNAIAAIGGSSAFAALWSGDSTHIAIWFSAIVAIATSSDLVIGFSKRSQLYDALLKRFSQLLNEIILTPHTAENLAKWRATRISIEEDEPTFLTLLVAICENEELLAKGHYNYVLKEMGWRRWLSHWISFDDFHEKLVSTQHPDQATTITAAPPISE